MNRFVTPILLIAAGIALFFMFTDETYSEVKALRQETARYDEVLTKSRELVSLRDTLLDEYNRLDQSRIERVEKLLPNNVDNVRLILEINSIAERYGMLVKDISISTGDNVEGQTVGESASKNYETISLDFLVSASYRDFNNFLIDLENSLRIVEIERIEFVSSDLDFYEYSIRIKTFWLGT